MRPTKESTPMVNWSKEQLLNILNDDQSPKNLKKEVVKIFKDRQEKGWIFLNRFFNQETNKFWNLAKWQLYREGKARMYGVGTHKRFYIDNPELIFDKMIEIKTIWDKRLLGKNYNEKTLLKEIKIWKR